jgi:malate dehydrogenase (oxaloacetate-decarboxylating)
MHDVHGTAVVTLAAAVVACRQAGFELREEVVGQIGLGTAGFGIASLMVLASDPNPASHERAKGIEITEVGGVLVEELVRRGAQMRATARTEERAARIEEQTVGA